MVVHSGGIFVCIEGGIAVYGNTVVCICGSLGDHGQLGQNRLVGSGLRRNGRFGLGLSGLSFGFGGNGGFGLGLGGLSLGLSLGHSGLSFGLFRLAGIGSKGNGKGNSTCYVFVLSSIVGIECHGPVTALRIVVITFSCCVIISAPQTFGAVRCGDLITPAGSAIAHGHMQSTCSCCGVGVGVTGSGDLFIGHYQIATLHRLGGLSARLRGNGRLGLGLRRLSGFFTASGSKDDHQRSLSQCLFGSFPNTNLVLNAGADCDAVGLLGNTLSRTHSGKGQANHTSQVRLPLQRTVTHGHIQDAILSRRIGNDLLCAGIGCNDLVEDHITFCRLSRKGLGGLYFGFGGLGLGLGGNGGLGLRLGRNGGFSFGLRRHGGLSGLGLNHIVHIHGTHAVHPYALFVIIYASQMIGKGTGTHGINLIEHQNILGHRIVTVAIHNRLIFLDCIADIIFDGIAVLVGHIGIHNRTVTLQSSGQNNILIVKVNDQHITICTV